MATSKTSGSGEKATATTAKTAGAAKSANGGTSPAKGAAGPAKKSGAAAKKAGGSTAKKGAGAAGGSGGGAANVQPKGRAPAKKSAGGASRAGGGDARRQVYRDFCESRLGGWSHDEWEGLIGDLQRGGHDVKDREAVGMELERERLSMVLEKVPGVNAQKAKSLVSRYGRLWDLRQASPDEIAEAGKVPRPLAERIAEAIR